jgi:vitamin B12 transporter
MKLSRNQNSGVRSQESGVRISKGLKWVGASAPTLGLKPKPAWIRARVDRLRSIFIYLRVRHRRVNNCSLIFQTLLLFLAIHLSITPSFAAQQPPEEKVVVTANAYPVPFENLSRTVTVFTREDIGYLPVHSIADVLALAASADMRSRAPFGLQADIKLRGSAYSQALILVDGVRINDSQTGHHNSDFPVQLQDVERIEVLLGPGSSIYGADAFGGIINIITRGHAEPFSASVSGGSHGFVEGSFSAGLHKAQIEQSISASGNRSSGFEYDRDFCSIAISSRTHFGDKSKLTVSYINKEFGANSFYGPAPSKEWTNQTFVSFEHKSNGTLFQGYYRTHGDRFLYDIRSPGLFENRHRTHSTGISAKSRYKLTDAGSITLGGEAGGDWIASSNLGNHAFARTSLFSEFQWTPVKTLAVYPGLRFDYYSNFGSAVSPSLSGSWWILPRIRLRSSMGRAFRIPTFTELYYRDPNNEANPSLKPESSWSEEIGTDVIPAKNWTASVNFFARQERNVIDWIRTSAAEKWRTSNIRRLHTTGFEIGIERSLGSQGRLETHYSRISTDAGFIHYTSKYVLDYARDSWSASTRFPIPLALIYQQTLTYKRRANGQSYWLLDGRVERRFRRFSASIDFTNLFDTRYQEIVGVDMPGRWFTLNLRTR